MVELLSYVSNISCSLCKLNCYINAFYSNRTIPANVNLETFLCFVLHKRFTYGPSESYLL